VSLQGFSCAAQLNRALNQDPGNQPAIFYLANGALSMISDNVFVASFINEVTTAMKQKITET
jgi:Na+/H+ antiporter NhaB